MQWSGELDSNPLLLLPLLSLAIALDYYYSTSSINNSLGCVGCKARRGSWCWVKGSLSQDRILFLSAFSSHSLSLVSCCEKLGFLWSFISLFLNLYIYIQQCARKSVLAFSNIKLVQALGPSIFQAWLPQHPSSILTSRKMSLSSLLTILYSQRSLSLSQ